MKALFTILQTAEYQDTIQRSRFIGHIYPVNSLEEAREKISSISSKYRDASHNCWAYAVGLKDIVYHSSDAGEPSGTAGRPIQGVLQKYNLTNVVLIITRYFGGTKLGIRGLIDAYTYVSEMTVKQAQLKESVMKDFYSIELLYQRLQKLKNFIRDKKAEIIDIKYGKEITLTLCINANHNIKEYLDAESSSGELHYDFIKSDIVI